MLMRLRSVQHEKQNNPIRRFWNCRHQSGGRWGRLRVERTKPALPEVVLSMSERRAPSFTSVLREKELIPKSRDIWTIVETSLAHARSYQKSKTQMTLVLHCASSFGRLQPAIFAAVRTTKVVNALTHPEWVLVLRGIRRCLSRLSELPGFQKICWLFLKTSCPAANPANHRSIQLIFSVS